MSPVEAVYEFNKALVSKKHFWVSHRQACQATRAV